MKTQIKFYIMLCIVTIVTIACNRRNVNLEQINNAQTSSQLIKEYVNNNNFIDIDINKLALDLANPKTRVIVNEEEIAKAKVALYRFYNNVSMHNKICTLNINNGADINISENLFQFLKQDLEQRNKNITKAIEKGENIEVTPIDSVYLKSLLQ